MSLMYNRTITHCAPAMARLSLMAFALLLLLPGSLMAQFLGNTIGGSIPANYATYWNQLTPENAGKWDAAEPSRDNYNWGPLDQLYNYANQQGMPFKGHTLIWGNQAPGWISSLPASQQRAEIEEWIRDYFARYPGTDLIDVVNEPLHAPPTQYLNSLGGGGATGWDWVITSFELARQYAPSDCKLILNDYGIISDPNAANRLMNIVNILNSRGLIDGIGIQCHAFNMDNVTTGTMRQVLDILDNAGLPIYVSELDIRGDDATQLQRYQQKFPIFWENPAVAGVTLWGYIEGRVWQPGAELLRSNGTERPAFTWLRSYTNGTPGGGGGDGGGTPSAFYRLQNRATGLFLDGLGRTANAEACGQYANTNSANAQWERLEANGYSRFRNRATGLFLDGLGRTTNGADVGQYANTNSTNAQWELVAAGGNYYRLRNRGTGLYLDGMGRTTNGAACGQYANTNSTNAQWQLVPVSSSARTAEALPKPMSEADPLSEAVSFYPNPVQETLHIQLGQTEGLATARLFNLSGQLLMSREWKNASAQLDASKLLQGVYVLEVTTASGIHRLKVVKE